MVAIPKRNGVEERQRKKSRSIQENVRIRSGGFSVMGTRTVMLSVEKRTEFRMEENTFQPPKACPGEEDRSFGPSKGEKESPRAKGEASTTEKAVPPGGSASEKFQERVSSSIISRQKGKDGTDPVKKTKGGGRVRGKRREGGEIGAHCGKNWGTAARRNSVSKKRGGRN